MGLHGHFSWVEMDLLALSHCASRCFERSDEGVSASDKLTNVIHKAKLNLSLTEGKKGKSKLFVSNKYLDSKKLPECAKKKELESRMVIEYLGILIINMIKILGNEGRRKRRMCVQRDAIIKKSKEIRRRMRTGTSRSVAVQNMRKGCQEEFW